MEFHYNIRQLCSVLSGDWLLIFVPADSVLSLSLVACLPSSSCMEQTLTCQSVGILQEVMGLSLGGVPATSGFLTADLPTIRDPVGLSRILTYISESHGIWALSHMHLHSATLYCSRMKLPRSWCSAESSDRLANLLPNAKRHAVGAPVPA